MPPRRVHITIYMALSQDSMVKIMNRNWDSLDFCQEPLLKAQFLTGFFVRK